MAVKRCESNIDVVKAAEIRIKNVFGNGLPVFFSFSGGKDSLCLAQLMVNLANRGEINMKQLTVQFIDEEAIFPCMEEIFRLSDFSKEDFLKMMTKGVTGYSKAEFITKI